MLHTESMPVTGADIHQSVLHYYGSLKLMEIDSLEHDKECRKCNLELKK